MVSFLGAYKTLEGDSLKVVINQMILMVDLKTYQIESEVWKILFDRMLQKPNRKQIWLFRRFKKRLAYSWSNRSKVSWTYAWLNTSRRPSVSPRNSKKLGQAYVRVTFGLKVRRRISETYAWPKMRNKLISQRDICEFTISSADILDFNHDFRF